MTDPTPQTPAAGDGRAAATPAVKPKPTLAGEIKDWITFLAVFFPLWMAFSTIAFALYRIPSESMVPSMEVDDRVLTNKFAYGYSRFSLPFGVGRLLPKGDGRVFGSVPKRGDVIVFAHPVDGKVLIKRVIGVPGDRIALNGGRLTVNNRPLAYIDQGVVRRYRFGRDGGTYETVAVEFEELAEGRVHYIHDVIADGRGAAVPPQSSDDFAALQVPVGRLFVMGDNRDRSVDSRFRQNDVLQPGGVGLVPIENVIGRAETVLFTLRLPWDSRTETDRPRLLRPLAPVPAPE